MMNMMNTMMNGGMSFMMPGMFLSTIFWLLLLTVLTWALLTWLNRRWGRPHPVPNTLQLPYSYHSYEQGYQPLSGCFREGERSDRSAQPEQEFDQPYVPYPQEQEMPPQF